MKQAQLLVSATRREHECRGNQAHREKRRSTENRDERAEHIAGILQRLELALRREGRSPATMSKYLRDVESFLRFAWERSEGEGNPFIDSPRDPQGRAGDPERLFLREHVLRSWRKELAGRYKLRSANSMIAAVNFWLGSIHREDLKLPGFRLQREAFRDDGRELSREEYHKLLNAATAEHNLRLFYLMQTLGSTGIRIGELPYITVEALERGKAEVSLKGKVRTVLLPGKLRDSLWEYANARGITRGSIFVTRSGRPLDRSNVLHEMKRLSVKAGVDAGKVFPHNLRHLFAVTYYQSSKDVCHLADLLGHSSIDTTRIYTATGQSALRRSIEELGLLKD